MALKDWSTTAGDNDDADASINWQENQAPSTVNNSARAMMAAIRSWYENVEFRDWGHTVTRTGNTTFTIAADVTSIYVANRPIRCTDSTTLYGFVASSSYSAPNTTVTVTLDSGNLSASLTAVALGLDPSTKHLPVQAIRNAGVSLLAGANAWTGNQTHAGTETFNGTATFNAGVEVNSTITLTSTDAGAGIATEVVRDRNSSTPAAADVLSGDTYKGRDSGGGTDTYVQTQAEIVDATATSEDGRFTVKTAVAGTLANRAHIGAGIYTSNATGGDKGADTVNASAIYDDGAQLTPVILLTGSSGPTATVDIDFSSLTAYEDLRVTVDVTVATDAVRVDARTATVAAPTSFASAANSYQFITNGENVGGTDIGLNSTTGTEIRLTGGGSVGNASQESFKCEITLVGRTDSTKQKLIRFRSWWTDNSTNLSDLTGTALRNTTDPIGAIRILASSGNVTVRWEVSRHS